MRSVGVLDAWPPLPLGAPFRRPLADLPFPLRRRGCLVFSRARHALWAATASLGLGEGEEVLMPAYNHGSEVEALLRVGLTLRFYDVDEHLEPNVEELESLLSPQTRALYLIHYFGFPQASSAWRAWCDEHGLILLEDAAQAWLAEQETGPVGAEADLAVYCLYKTFGLPDGAALYGPNIPDRVSGRHPIGVSAELRRHAAWLEGRSAAAHRIMQGLRDGLNHGAHEEFALGAPAAEATVARLRLLERVAQPGVAAKRRANAERLLADLDEDAVPVFSSIPRGASPFVFGVVTDEKAVLLEQLLRCGIRALDVWSQAHPAVPVGGFPQAAFLRSRVVGLPVHQELRAQDVDRISAAVAGPRRKKAARRKAESPLDALADEWRELADGSQNIFSTWEWATTWWRHFGAGKTAHATLVRSEGRPLAIVPVYGARRGALRMLRLIGHGAGDELGPVCRRDDRRDPLVISRGPRPRPLEDLGAPGLDGAAEGGVGDRARAGIF